MSLNNLLISWSTGKDSAYSLHLLQEAKQYQIKGLMTTVTEDYDRVSMHATRLTLLQKQAELVNLPLNIIYIPHECNNDTYATRMAAFIDEAINNDISHIAFGDLFLEDIRNYREQQLQTTSITPIFPLWKKNTKMLAHEIIESGIKAVVTCIDSKKLDISFIGRIYDDSFLQDLPDYVDPCGENGEFHTFVFDSPMFEREIAISIGDIVTKDEFIFRDIEILTSNLL